MKKVIITLALIVIAFAMFAQEIEWYKNIENALVEAEKEDKTVFIHFTGSDWCVWCHRLEGEVYEKESFMKYANENLVMVKLDFPRNIPQAAAEKEYNNIQAQKFMIRGFPTVLLLDKNGKLVGKTGYQRGGPDNYVEHLKSFIDVDQDVDENVDEDEK
ncbi:MAG: thioredoxin family protein [Candidatus Cloacimonadota bacterium]|nr:thioredoxin family protein [Candidatus Cloacimonadota bacterium]